MNNLSKYNNINRNNLYIFHSIRFNKLTRLLLLLLLFNLAVLHYILPPIPYIIFEWVRFYVPSYILLEFKESKSHATFLFQNFNLIKKNKKNKENLKFSIHLN